MKGYQIVKRLQYFVPLLVLFSLVAFHCNGRRGEPMKTENTAPIENSEKATFAGGCFWCMEHPFEKIDGVYKVISGYIGGQKANPTYEEVCSDTSGHYEAVEITYDPKKVSYSRLLEVFWRQIDPTDPKGQFADKGSQYKSAIFYHSPEQKKEAQKSMKQLEDSKKFSKSIVTKIIEASTFYHAEDYHQDYYLKNPGRYLMYRRGSGREQFLKTIWGDEK